MGEYIDADTKLARRMAEESAVECPCCGALVGVTVTEKLRDHLGREVLRNWEMTDTIELVPIEHLEEYIEGQTFKRRNLPHRFLGDDDE